MTADNPTQLENKVEPCPCKSVTELRFDRIEVGNWIQVVCDNCGRRGAQGGSQWMAITLWNQDRSRAPVVAPQEDSEAKAKEIVEEYKQRVMQLPSGDAVPCAKWLEMRLRIAFDLASPSSPEQGAVTCGVCGKSGPHVCDLCGHGEVGDDGRCKHIVAMSQMINGETWPEPMPIYCSCKCEFPAATPAPVEQSIDPIGDFVDKVWALTTDRDGWSRITLRGLAETLARQYATPSPSLAAREAAEAQACWVDPDDPRRVKMISASAETASAFVDDFARTGSLGEEGK